MTYCKDCGNFYNDKVECPFIWQICTTCGNKCKTAPDVPQIVDVSNMTCAKCGTKGVWRFEENV